MATAIPKAPASFGATQKKRALESHQSMNQALKEHRFEDALEHARTALALDPKNAMIKEFIRLLEEKQELDETDDESDTEGVAAGTGAVDAESGDSEDDDVNEDDDDEDEDESSDEDEESEDEDPAVIRALEALRLSEPIEPSDGPRLPTMSNAQREALRATLGHSVKKMLQAEIARRMMASDPLLGA